MMESTFSNENCKIIEDALRRIGIQPVNGSAEYLCKTVSTHAKQLMKVFIEEKMLTFDEMFLITRFASTYKNHILGAIETESNISSMDDVDILDGFYSKTRNTPSKSRLEEMRRKITKKRKMIRDQEEEMLKEDTSESKAFLKAINFLEQTKAEFSELINQYRLVLDDMVDEQEITMMKLHTFHLVEPTEVSTSKDFLPKETVLRRLLADSLNQEAIIFILKHFTTADLVLFRDKIDNLNKSPIFDELQFMRQSEQHISCHRPKKEVEDENFLKQKLLDGIVQMIRSNETLICGKSQPDEFLPIEKRLLESKIFDSPKAWDEIEKEILSSFSLKGLHEYRLKIRCFLQRLMDINLLSRIEDVMENFFPEGKKFSKCINGVMLNRQGSQITPTGYTAEPIPSYHDQILGKMDRRTNEFLSRLRGKNGKKTLEITKKLVTVAKETKMNPLIELAEVACQIAEKEVKTEECSCTSPESHSDSVPDFSSFTQPSFVQEILEMNERSLKKSYPENFDGDTIIFSKVPKRKIGSFKTTDVQNN